MRRRKSTRKNRNDDFKSVRKARKEYKCCNCGNKISIGDNYINYAFYGNRQQYHFYCITNIDKRLEEIEIETYYDIFNDCELGWDAHKNQF